MREDETWEDLVRRFGEERAIELFLEGLILQKSRAGKKAQGALVRLLLDLDRPFSPLIRTVLAELFGSGQITIHNKKQNTEIRMWKIAFFVDDRRAAGEKWEAAVAAAMSKFRIGRATVARAIKTVTPIQKAKAR